MNNHSRTAVGSMQFETTTSVTTTSTSTSKRDTKPRMSRIEKNERKQKRLPEQGNDNLPPSATTTSSKPPQQLGIENNEKRMKMKHDNSSVSQLSSVERINQAVEKSIFTGAVTVLRNGESDGKKLCNNNNHSVSIVTSCHGISDFFHHTKRKSSSNSSMASTTTTVQIKPLIVLDLNGILCHRVRLSKECHAIRNHKEPHRFFRPVCTHVANTEVIPRPNLNGFLRDLSQHFCLAVWTSAKSKNARILIDNLFPPDVAKKLLFVWAQHDCQEIKVETTTNKNTTKTTGNFGEHNHGRGDGYVEDVVFVKDLEKVWKRYPLWNSNNTILLDDSPEKCYSWRENSVHPPPLNGLRELLHHFHNSTGASTSDDLILDDENVQYQNIFFDELINYWKENYFVEDWDEESDDAIITYSNRKRRMIDFLRRHGAGFMGWSTSSTINTKTKQR